MNAARERENWFSASPIVGRIVAGKPGAVKARAANDAIMNGGAVQGRCGAI